VRGKVVFLFLVTLVLTLGTFLASQSFSEGNNALSNTNQPVEKIGNSFVESSWAHWYPDFESLMENHDLVLVGKVIKSQLDPLDQVFTFHEVLVQTIIRDSSNEVEKGSTIAIYQFGGIWTPSSDLPPVQVELIDCPLMKEGETSLLFLNQRSDGIYAGISPQTRFIVKDDKVHWLGAIYENKNIVASENLQIEEKGLRETVSMLQQLP
jgi:hypothetical protein